MLLWGAYRVLQALAAAAELVTQQPDTGCGMACLTA